MSNAFQAMPRYRKKLSARAYLQLTQEERTNIVKVRMIPPQLGRHDFGKFEVTYRRPVYEIAAHG